MKETPIVSLGELPSIRKKHIRNKIVLMGGGFDLVHPGHIKQLQWAKSKGDILVVHITGERRFIEKKGRKPLFSEVERATIIGAMKPVDYVFVYNGRHYDKAILDKLCPDVIAFNQEAYKTAKEEARRTGYTGKIAVSRFKKNHSSNELRKIVLAKNSSDPQMNAL